MTLKQECNLAIIKESRREHIEEAGGGKAAAMEKKPAVVRWTMIRNMFGAISKMQNMHVKNLDNAVSS